MQSEPDDNLANYVPGHAFVIVGRHPNGDPERVCYHCSKEERQAGPTCLGNSEWTVLE